MDREPTGTKFADKKRWRLGNIYDEFLVSFDAGEAALLLPPLFISNFHLQLSENLIYCWAKLAEDSEKLDAALAAPTDCHSPALARIGYT